MILPARLFMSAAKKKRIDGSIELKTNDELLKPQVFPRFLSDAECDRVIDMVASYADQNSVVQDSGAPAGELARESFRSSHVKWINPGKDSEWLYKKVETQITTANNIFRYDVKGFFENMQVSTYHVGGHYDWHIDIGQGSLSTRKLSISVELTDSASYEGGGLEFRCGAKPFTVARGRGTAIIFPSFLLHRVVPVTNGTRQSLVSWIGGAPFR